MIRYLSNKEAQNLLKCGATWMRELRKRPDFPKPIRLSQSATARLKWREDEMLAWLESQREASE